MEKEKTACEKYTKSTERHAKNEKPTKKVIKFFNTI